LAKIHRAFDHKEAAEQELKTQKRELADARKSRMDALKEANESLTETVNNGRKAPKKDAPTKLSDIIASFDDRESIKDEHDASIRVEKEKVEAAEKQYESARNSFKESIINSKQQELFD
jgi:hypothetical protein